MIKQTTLASLRVLSQKLQDKNISLQAKPATPLAIVVGACYTPIMDDTALFGDTNVQAMDILYRIADNTSKPTLNDTPMHGDYLETAVRTIAKTVQTNLFLARNVVNPAIAAVVEAVEAAQKQAATAMATVLSIVPDQYESIWSSTLLDSMVERYKDTPALSNAVMPNIHPLLTDDAIRALLKTGAGRFDKEVEAWVEEIGIETVIDVYRSYFSVNSQSGLDDADTVTPIGYAMGMTPEARRKTLIIHLLARRLSANVLEGIEMELNDYRELMAGVIEQSGRGVCRILETRTRNRLQKRMITRWPQEGAEYMVSYPEAAQIEVNNDLYEEWLERGGRPEILYGSFITDRNENPETLLAKGAEYVLAWSRRAALVRSAQRSDGFNTTLSALRASITTQINTMSDDHLVEGSRGPLHERLLAALETLSIGQAGQLYECVKSLVCHVMFPHTDARLILDTIDRIGSDNPDLDIREVALLAAIDILTRWVSQMYTINHE